MKKLLALVLALVMTLGLATVSSSAAYSDAADIEYTEAVDVMTAVGAFQGKGDSFAPNDNLNRAEAAKLVAYLMLGNKTAESMIGSGTRFTDVPASHWAAGFIEYLASVGIVSGVGNGNFDPNGQVTGVQFAKMLLVALGYDAEIEKFVGDGWSINIQKIANQNDLFSGLDISANAALTRQQAAQMCLNDLKANMVEYEDKGTTVNVGGATVVTGVKNAKEKVEKGSNNFNGAAVGTSDRNYRQLAEELYGNDLKLDDAGRDDFGRPANKWTYKLEKVGTYAATGDLMGTYTAEIKRGPIYDLVGKTVYDNLVDGKSDLYFFEDGVGYNNTTSGLVNGTAATRLADVEKFVQKNGDKAINAGDSSGNGSLTQVYVDDDDNVTITVVNTYIFQATSDYRKSTQDIVVSVPSDAAKQAVTSVDNNRLKLEDFPEIESFKKDDYLLVTAYKDGNKWTADSVAKAELKTATVDKVVVEDSITLDGTVTKYGKKATSDTKKTEYSVGQETTVVLDKYGYIMYVDNAVVANNYVFISELYQNGGTTTNVQANAYFTDGTNKAITVKKVAGISDKTALVKQDTVNTNMRVGVVKASNNVSNLAGWYTYTVNSSNEYTLNALSSSYHEENGYALGKAGGVTLTNSDAVKFIANLTEAGTPYASKTAVPVSGATAKANDKTIMVVTYADKTDVDVYTGVKNIPEIKLTAADGKGAIFSVLDSSNYAKYVFVTLEGNTSVFGTESENLLYVVKYDHDNREKDNKTYYTYKALDENAKEITIEASEDLGSGDIYTAYYKTSKDSDGRYTRIEPVVNKNGKYMEATGLTQSTGKIVADGNTLDIGGDSFTLADNYKLVVVSKMDTLNRLIKDNKGYEADIMTAEGLEGLLQDYNYTYDVQAKTSDDYTGKGGKLVEAYVTITAATAKGTTGSTYALTVNNGTNVTKAETTTTRLSKTSATTATITVTGTFKKGGTITVPNAYSVNNLRGPTYTVTADASSITLPVVYAAATSNVTSTVSYSDAGTFTNGVVTIDSITPTAGRASMMVSIDWPAYADFANNTAVIDAQVLVNGRVVGKVSDFVGAPANRTITNPNESRSITITSPTIAENSVVTIKADTITQTYGKVLVKYIDVDATKKANGTIAPTANTAANVAKWVEVDSSKLYKTTNTTSAALTATELQATVGTGKTAAFFYATADHANYAKVTYTIGTASNIKAYETNGTSAEDGTSGLSFAVSDNVVAGTDYAYIFITGLSKLAEPCAIKYQAAGGTSTAFATDDTYVSLGTVAANDSNTDADATVKAYYLGLKTSAKTVLSTSATPKVTLTMTIDEDSTIAEALSLAAARTPIKVTLTDGTNDYEFLFPNDGNTQKVSVVTKAITGDVTYSVKSVEAVTVAALSKVTLIPADSNLTSKIATGDTIKVEFTQAMVEADENGDFGSGTTLPTSMAFGNTTVSAWAWTDAKTLVITVDAAHTTDDTLTINNDGAYTADLLDANGCIMNGGTDYTVTVPGTDKTLTTSDLALYPAG